jgi:hypothetical protein
MADVLTTEITVPHGADEYVFRIPSPRDYGKMAVRARALRMADDPDGASEYGLDRFTASMYRGMALFEVLLSRASVTWPWTQTDKGLVIRSENFPPQAIKTLVEVFEGFDESLTKFLYGGVGDGVEAGAEAVAGQPNP